jgi:hypothetical protein
VIFDILTHPAPELSTAERDEVKKVAKDHRKVSLHLAFGMFLFARKVS